MAKPRPDLHVIPPRPSPDLATPPGQLGAVGMSLWNDIVAAYEFSDRGSYESLYQACCAADRAASLRVAIERDGEVIKTKAGLKDHPCLKHELANRAFVTRALARLGLDLEPVLARGRQPGVV
jgi:hypothetical protein